MPTVKLAGQTIIGLVLLIELPERVHGISIQHLD
jgi:hypothetical protein